MITAWQSVLDEPRAPGPQGSRRRVLRRRDLVLVAAVVVSATLEVAFRQDLPLPWLAWLVTVGMSPALLWRRSHPFAAVVLAFGAAAVVDVGVALAGGSTVDMYSGLYFLVLPYALFRWGSGREAAAGFAVILVAAVLALLRDWTGFGEAIGGTAVLFSAVAVGVAVRTQHGARDRRLEQVKADERVQLARELHDTVAHHVSAIAVQAQAGRALAATSPESSADVFEVIEQEASRTLAEMRAMVRVLRNQDPVEFAPQPGVRDVEGLTDAASTHPRVRVTLTGDLTELPTAVDAAVYRISQEAVTNARRHARNATVVDVRVDGDESAVRVVVRDDGDPSLRPGSPPGFGITGMVERAHLLGGECRVGPGADRGWTVEATLPREVVR